MSNEDIRRYTAAELNELRARGGPRSDFARLDAMTEEELEASIADDPDWRDIPREWYKDAVMAGPTAKKLLSLRLDPEIVTWFREQGPGYQTRMNAVLRAYVDQKRRADGRR